MPASALSGEAAVDREHFYSIMNGEGTLDYEVYLNTKRLLTCQKDFKDFCNADELQFQVVHQVEELWMKLMGYTLLDIDEYIQQENTNRVLTLFKRVHLAQRLLIDQLALLETMSPKEYQEIRLGLGQGSGQEARAAARNPLASAPC
jgi:tryptophan 2,3-dioxygenase